MEMVLPIIVVIVLVFITCTICGYCCKRNKQGVVYGVYTTTTTEPAIIPGQAHYPPYQPPGGYPPVAAPYPPESSVIPGQGPYPPMPMPMPMPGGGAYTAPVPPYPTHNHPAATQLPPSYAEAVTQPPTNEVYAKQSPYNPNYN